jgi:hypothetical protein
MTIAVFGNRGRSPLTLTIEPWGAKHEIPHLGEIGIRYTLKEGAEDRCYWSCSEEGVEFWCNADSFEVDIVIPSARDTLLWDICLNGGWPKAGPMPEEHLRWLEAKFKEHSGAASVAVKALHRLSPRPFGKAST